MNLGQKKRLQNFHLRPFAIRLFGHVTSVLLFEEIKIIIEKIEPGSHVITLLTVQR
jgi:hypothetical protein